MGFLEFLGEMFMGQHGWFPALLVWTFAAIIAAMVFTVIDHIYSTTKTEFRRITGLDYHPEETYPLVQMVGKVPVTTMHTTPESWHVCLDGEWARTNKPTYDSVKIGDTGYWRCTYGGFSKSLIAAYPK